MSNLTIGLPALHHHGMVEADWGTGGIINRQDLASSRNYATPVYRSKISLCKRTNRCISYNYG